MSVHFLKENLPEIKLTEPEGTYLLWLDFNESRMKRRAVKKIWWRTKQNSGLTAEQCLDRTERDLSV